jgi:ABC-2 type transport system ATP-binding protein
MIQTFGLTKRYGRAVALRDVTLEIPPGGITALVGPNGAGKSTLMKMCIGFERPTAGRLEACGIDPVRNRRGAVATIGYVPQSPSLYRDMSIAGHLDHAWSIRPGFDREHARLRLAALDIPIEAKAGELSGGQAAQVSLALALGTRAPLLLFDEPLASLDPLARRDFLRIAKDEARTGDVSIVLSSHVISEIEMTADRLLVLSDGQVVFHDTVAGSVAGHRVIEPATPYSGPGVIGSFPGRADDEHILVQTTDADLGRQPDLEEVVLGYLAASRRAARA